MKVVTSQCKTTLLLNNAWQPINAITARAAFIHLMKGRIAALDKNNNIFHSMERWNGEAELFEDQPVLRSARGVWPIPTVIVVTHKFFRRPKKKRLSLYEMAKMYNYVCQYCLNKFNLKDLTIDHITPKSKGGGNDHDNLILSCFSCNTKKSSHTPWYNIKGELPKPLPMSNLTLNTHNIRKEWEFYL
jgi:5-methylcytosine-specific restriction endonuclease McrA